MRLSKTLLISAALAAFMAVAVAQDAPPATDSNGDTSVAAPTTSNDASDAIFFADDDDGSDDPEVTPDTAVDGDDNGDDDGADGEEEDSNAVHGDNDDGDAEEEGDDSEDQQASSLVKRASHRRRRAVPRKTIAIESKKSFCLLLPPKAGGDIAKSEGGAIAYCINPHTSTTPGALKFPSGFIKSAHLRHNRGAHDYVQVTGRIDRTKYKLLKNDQGGQNDIKSTKGSACAGYNHFVQLIEPNDNIYCLRCCIRKEDCPTGKSEKGCRAIISNGNYN
ncbi:hypothetical protein BGZ70_002213 [Mortierella alpina]|uniref:Uncharacterized protein n=1 Tax=Mortierella alpina TaxID=64518 RepID=A0A9P6IUG9_MORAP|nr:hypothetical protein BGZ70_002213 [Mortierella alpina]